MAERGGAVDPAALPPAIPLVLAVPSLVWLNVVKRQASCP